MVYEIEELRKKMIESYTDFQKNKNFISINKDNEILEKEYREIKDGKFTLMIAGEAKSGKSTFINTFLGKEILPTDVKQCTSSIIKIKYGENLSLILKYMNESKIITDFETIKRKLKEEASVNEEYRSLPVFLINEFILRNQNSINEKMIEKFIKSVEKENIYEYSYEEYSQKIRNYIQDKKNWDKIVTEIEISYPFENDILKNVVIIDSPGVNAEGRLGDITNRIIKDMDAIIFVKAISGQALEKSSFMEFIKENSNGKDKESIFLLLTHSVDVKKEELEILKEEAIKMYGNRIDPRQIKYLDSKVQLFINEIKEMSSNEIEEHLEKLEKKKLYFDFMTPPLRMKELNNEYIEYLKEKSNFDNVYKDIIKFIYENQYRKIESFLDKIKSHTVLKSSYDKQKQKVLELNERFQEIIEKNDIKKKVSQIQKFIDRLNYQIENINSENLEELKKEAKRLYGSKIREEQIVAVDSKVQMFVNKISKYSTYEDIEEYLDELEENNQFEDFMNPPRRIRKEKNSYINYLTEKSRFKDINEAIEKFARKTQYYALDEVVKGILNICKKIEDSIKYDMELYIKNSTEFDIQIFKIQNNINIVNERIYKKVDKMREKYMSYNPKGIIEMKVEENFLKLIKEINNLNGKSENYINNLEEKVFKKIEELKEFYEIIQKNIVREFNKEIFPLRDRFEISYLNIGREFTKKDFENMKNESKKNAYEKKSYEKGFLFKKSYHYSEYSQVKHFMILKYDVINRIEEINNKIKINLINFIQNIINKYIEILFQNMKNQKEKLLELQEEREVIEEKIVKLRHIIQEVSSFRNKVRLFERKIEEDI